MASAATSTPGLVWISEHKDYVFAFAACMLTLSGYLRYRNRHAACPTDQELAKSCMKLRRISNWVYGISLTIFTVGFFFAYIARYIF